jgi:hypothetical protein
VTVDCARISPGDAMSDRADSAELLDIDVDELTRLFAFIAASGFFDLAQIADGLLTVYIQNKSPGAGKEANWLPAPDGPIYLVIRLYWPKATPPGDGLRRLPALHLPHNPLSAARCEPGILMHVHPVPPLI